MVRILPGFDPAEHLAAEDALFRQRAEGILLWRNDPCVILGKNQDAARETTPLCRASVPVLRRTTGGGAVYHDRNNVNYSFLLHETAPRALHAYLAPVLNALRAFGADVSLSGRNDILLGGKKISGSAMRHSAGQTLVHGTLLFRSDFAAIESYLTPSAAKLKRHGVSSVGARVGELAPYLPQFADTAAFMHALEKYFAENY